MTHKELVARAVKWLQGGPSMHRCSVICAELVSAGSESPDAIGWHWGNSELIECKASRSDFLADKHKNHRIAPHTGMGEFRWYMTPPDMVSPEEIPEGWGLLYAYPKMVRVVREAEFQKCNHKNERIMLNSLLRRIAQVQPEGLFARHYAPENSANISIEADAAPSLGGKRGEGA